MDEHTAENDAAEACAHLGLCPPPKSDCRWVQFERRYDYCACGGWDERYVSRDGGTRVRGRSNHARACVIPPGKGD